MKVLALLVTYFLTTQIMALEVDEKLTARLLRLSASKKTVLMNRGLEDGLVVGDHAKFYLTTGVVARGMVQKVSPTRSIWSVYRIVDADVLRTDQVVNLKISPPVKLTDDPSQSFIAQSTTLDEQTGIPLAEGANDLVGADLNNEEAGEFAAVARGDFPDSVNARMEERESVANSTGEVVVRSSAGMSPNRTLEFYGLVHMNALSTSAEMDTGEAVTGDDSSMAFSIGVEKYFNRPSGFLRDLSMTAFVHRASNTSTSSQGVEASSAAFEYGVGLNYHFLAAPLAYNSLIGYVGVGLGMGSSEDSVSFSTSSGAAEPETLTGSTTFFSLSGGIKYYLPNGFGMRASVDYYRRGEAFTVEDEALGESVEYTKVVSGPRIQLGLSYRF